MHIGIYIKIKFLIVWVCLYEHSVRVVSLMQTPGKGTFTFLP